MWIKLSVERTFNFILKLTSINPKPLLESKIPRSGFVRSLKPLGSKKPLQAQQVQMKIIWNPKTKQKKNKIQMIISSSSSILIIKIMDEV